MDYVKALTEFQSAVYEKTRDYRNKPNGSFIDNATVARLMNLISEEWKELMEAMDGEDILEVRKELCDLIYVCFGAAVILGLPVDEDFVKVHENNMLKIINGTVREDGKLIKPVDHPKVQL